MSCCTTAPHERVNHGHTTLETFNVLHWSFPLPPSGQKPFLLHQLTQHLHYSLLQLILQFNLWSFSKRAATEKGYETTIYMSSNLQKQNPILCKQDSTNKGASALLLASKTQDNSVACHSCFFSPHSKQTFKKFGRILTRRINCFLQIMHLPWSFAGIRQGRTSPFGLILQLH